MVYLRMTNTLTAAEYDRLVEQIADVALADMQEHDGVPTDDLASLEMGEEGVVQCLEKAILLTPYDAFNDQSLAAHEDEMSAALAGSIIEHSDAKLPEERFNTREWDSTLHIQRVASNYLYADVRQAVINHFRARVSRSQTSLA